MGILKADDYKLPWRHLTVFNLSVFNLAKKSLFYWTAQDNDSDSEGNDSDSGTTVCVNRGPIAAMKKQSDKQTTFGERDFSAKLKVSCNIKK